MKPRIVVPLLAAATLAIGVENWLYFTSDAAAVAAPAADAEGSDPANSETGADAHATPEVLVEPPPLLSGSTLAALLESFDALRSPFLPGGAEMHAEVGMPIFGGLLIGTERRVAWLGNHARSEGQLYEGWTVARVETSRVVLERGGRRYSLWLGAPHVDVDPDSDLASKGEPLP